MEIAASPAMKQWLSKYGIHACIWMILAAYIAAFNVLYVRFFARVGRPAFVGEIALPQTEMLYAIETLEQVSEDGQEVYKLMGWGFPRDLETPIDRFQKKVLLLDQDSRAYVFDAETMTRVGVTEAFRDLGRNLDESGFYALISKYALHPGRYRVGIVYAEEGRSSLYFPTYTYIERTPNMMVFAKSGEPAFVGEIREPQTEMTYAIDALDEISGDDQPVYRLIGWAFPRGKDTPVESYSKQVVLLDEASRAYVFDAQTMTREGVTEAFADLGRDLDESGFFAFVSGFAIRPGRYRVGILYREGGHSSLYFLTDTYIERTPNTMSLSE